MLSSARYPSTLFGPLALPGIAPHSIDVFAVLRACHGAFALLPFLAFTAHMTAVLFHTLVLRTGSSIAWRRGVPNPPPRCRTEPELKSEADGLPARVGIGRI